MAVTNIINRLKLNDNWVSVDLKTFNSCYLIAIKEKQSKTDNIDVNLVRKIRFEIGIDSGIKNKPLTIQYLNINFNDITASDNEINKITAFSRLTNLPNQFYIKVVSIDDGNKEIKTGETSISINLNAINLG